jgi:hypothetical protein
LVVQELVAIAAFACRDKAERAQSAVARLGKAEEASRNDREQNTQQKYARRPHPIRLPDCCSISASTIVSAASRDKSECTQGAIARLGEAKRPTATTIRIPSNARRVIFIGTLLWNSCFLVAASIARRREAKSRQNAMTLFGESKKPRGESHDQ